MSDTMKVLTVSYDVSGLNDDEIESLQLALESQGEEFDHGSMLLTSSVKELDTETLKEVNDINHH